MAWPRGGKPDKVSFPTTTDIVVHLSAEPSAAQRARAHVEGLVLPLGRARRDDLRLLVSELVTNSVRHAGLGPGQPSSSRSR